MSKLYVDIHVLQSVPPSNINRDDTGAPKTAWYGGVQRARVSSQAWKRATRMAFKESMDSSDLGVRTTRVVTTLAERMRELNPNVGVEEASAQAAATLKAVGLKLEKPRARAKDAEDGTEPDERSRYLVFFSAHQLTNLAHLTLEAMSSGSKVDTRSVREAARQDHSIDVAMFGRMVADDKELNVDAAVQVAHAISVHAVDNEYDYFTAVDDRNVDDAGAGMIGTVEFNSSTLYRYATVNVHGLERNLGSAQAAAKATATFVESFVTSMPTGKQNTFANRTLPEAVVVMLRTKQPVNLVGAFEQPVVAQEHESRLAKACERLVDHAKSIDAVYGTGASHKFVVRVGEQTKALASYGEGTSMESLTSGLEPLVNAVLAEGAA